MYPVRLNTLLNKRVQEDNYRSLKIEFQQGIDFLSNDYLGLSKNPELLKIVDNQRTTLGSGGSRLLAGNTRKMTEVERFLAQYYGFESGLLFGSGYMANLGLFSSIAGKEDIILYDQNIHASAREGIRLSLAKNYSFKHNDWQDLESKIQKAEGNIFVAVEGIYSMDGDSCDIQKLIQLVDKYGVFLIVDEAHSVGILGEKGKGITENIPNDKLFAVLYTFGKALGYHASFLAGNQRLIDFIVNFSRPFIYTTALPESDFIIIQCIHEFLENNFSTLRTDLQKNIETFEKLYTHTSNGTPIKIVENQRIEEINQTLSQHHIHTKIIKYPTVPKGKEIIRLVLHSYNTEEEIQLLTDILNEK